MIPLESHSRDPRPTAAVPPAADSSAMNKALKPIPMTALSKPISTDSISIIRKTRPDFRPIAFKIPI